jgi:hypothetical protein
LGVALSMSNKFFSFLNDPLRRRVVIVVILGSTPFVVLHIDVHSLQDDRGVIAEFIDTLGFEDKTF